MDPDRLIARITEFAEALPEHAAAIKKRVEAEGLARALISRLTDQLESRAKQCRTRLPKPRG